MFLIDVDQGCLVKVATCPNYVALSYVWGTERFITLQKEDLDAFQRPQGITRLLQQLPQTIQDAISLTRMVGLRYLWVDSLCIIQDDDTFKSKIIQKMNLVYANAFLTIFSASGSHAGAGLFGNTESLRPKEKHVAKVGSDLALVYPRSHQHLARSIWATRSWTYQEYYFSRRKLIFLEDTVYFHCKKQSWRDDVSLEHWSSVPDQFDLYRGFNAAQDIWEQPRHSASSDKTTAAHSHYWSAVKAYQKRQLTYQGDRLNAFAGILEDARTNHSLETLWGIPESTFLEDLLWSTAAFSGRRGDFPSWSWLGWQQEEVLPSRVSTDSSPTTSWTPVFQIAHSPRGKLSLRRLSTDSWDRNQAVPPTDQRAQQLDKLTGYFQSLVKSLEETKPMSEDESNSDLNELKDEIQNLLPSLQSLQVQQQPQQQQSLLRRVEAVGQKLDGALLIEAPPKPQMEKASCVKKLLVEIVTASEQELENESRSSTNMPEVHRLLKELALQVRNGGLDPLQKEFAKCMGPPKFLERALYIPTLTTEIWISACAPNGQIVGMRPSPTTQPEIVYRPTLYAYAARRDPQVKPLGLVWLQTSQAYGDVLRRSTGVRVKPEEIQSRMNPGNQNPVSVIGNPSRLFASTVPKLKKTSSPGPGSGPPVREEQSSSQGEALSTAKQEDIQKQPLSPAAAELKERLLNIGRKDDFSWQSMCQLPSDATQRSAILASRRVKKARIAIISGPVGEVGQRFGVPFAFPLKKRRFIRALVLLDQKVRVQGQMALCSERMGTLEMELDAFAALDFKFEDVILV